MAEDEEKGLNPTEGGNPKDDESGQGGVAFTEAQMAEISKMIQSQTDKTAAKLKAQYNSENSALQEKLTRLEREKMTDDERKQAEREEYNTLKAQLEADRKAFSLQKSVESELRGAGLSLDFAKRINGETEEEIKADVQALKTLFNNNVNQVVEKVVNERLSGKSPKGTEETKNTITRSDFDKLSDYEKMEKIKAGIQVVEG